MTKTYPGYIKFPNAYPNVRYYRFDSISANRTIKNKLLKVSRRVSRGRQDGTEEGNTRLVDMKEITDGFKFQGEIRRQDYYTAPSSETDANPTFTDSTPANIKNVNDVVEKLIFDFKATKGPYYFYFKGNSYEVMMDQIEVGENALLKQSSNNGTDLTSSEKLKISIDFVVGEYY